MSSVEFELSRGQRALWWAWQTAPTAAMYNTASVFRIRGPLAVDALRRSWETIIARHGTFRTVLTPGLDGYPRQARHATLDAPFVVHQVHGATDPELEDRMRVILEEPFDLQRRSSVDLHLLRTSATDHVVLIRLHHLYNDFGSTDCVQAELLQLYQAELRGEPLELSLPAADYDEHVAAESAFLASDACATSLSYWRSRLTDYPEQQLDLPTDRPRGSAERRGATYTTSIRGGTELADFCKRSQVSPFRVLLAGYAALLHRWSGENDLTVGAPTDCRGPRFSGATGYFANMLPFRFRIAPGANFVELVRHVNAVVREGLTHRFVPFSTLVDKLWRPSGRDASSPFFRTTFALARAQRFPPLSRSYMVRQPPWSESVGDFVLTEPPLLRQQEGMFDLSLWTWDLPEGLVVELKYDSDLFSASAVRRLANHYEALLQGMLATPDAPISAHPIIAPEELAVIHSALSAPATERLREPAHAAFCRTASRTPDAPALLHEGRTWSYAETLRRATAVASVLQQRGVGAGELVAVLLPKGNEAVATFLGILMAGAAFVPVDPAYPAERIRMIVDDVAPRFAFADAAMASYLDDATAVLDVPEPTGTASFEPPPIDVEGPAYAIYTSGSTGKPKGVVVSHRGVPNIARALGDEWELTGSSRVFCFAPLSFDACIADLFPSFLAGASVHLGEDPWPAGGELLSSFLRRERISHVTLPPSVWLSLPDTPLPDLLVGVSAGEACPQEVVSRWGRGRAFFNNYGPTEITVCATTKRCTPGETPTIGRPIPGIRARVVDAGGASVPLGCLGELWLGGEGLALSYWRRPDLTAERFVVDPADGTRVYRTGDMVRVLPSGELTFVGRADEQVKLRGFRIELAEIEEAMRTLPGVVDGAAAVVTVGTARVLAAYVIGDAEGLQDRLRDLLPRHMVPGVVVPITSLPRTPSGKVDRPRLPAPLVSAGGHRPATAVEQTIVDAWRKVLGHENFGTRDDFFAIGGDSLSAVEVLHIVSSKLGVSLTPDVLISHGTVRELARWVTSRPSKSSVVELARGTGPAVVLVHPAGGDLVAYRSLVSHLPGVPILGIRPPTRGDKNAPDEDLSTLVDGYAADLGEIIRAPVVLVGWSFGGVVAQELAIRLHPERLRGVLLLDALPRFPELVPLAGNVGDPVMLLRHAALYRSHVPRAAALDVDTIWAKDGGNMPGSWQPFCRVRHESVVDTTHEGLLRAPALSAVVRGIRRLLGDD